MSESNSYAQMNHPLPHREEHARFNREFFKAIEQRSSLRLAALLCDPHHMSRCNLNALAPSFPQQTPLQAALSSTGSPQGLAKLLIPLSDPNVLDAHGESALMIAASKGLSSHCKALLDAGADARATNQCGQTPLIIAAKYGNPATVSALLPHSNPTHQCKLGYTAMMESIKRLDRAHDRDGRGPSKNAQTWRRLIASADFKIADINGDTALHHAALSCGRWPVDLAAELLAILLSRSNLEALDNEGDSATSVALRTAPATLSMLFEQAELHAMAEPSMAVKRRTRSL